MALEELSDLAEHPVILAHADVTDDGVVHIATYGFSVMFLLILVQLILAVYHQAPEAIKLDAALLGGTLIFFADFFENWYLLDFQMFFYVMGEFYCVVILRHLQDAGTSFVL